MYGVGASPKGLGMLGIATHEVIWLVGDRCSHNSAAEFGRVLITFVMRYGIV